jgi:GDP-D-mannose 3', 5'-epimerase
VGKIPKNMIKVMVLGSKGFLGSHMVKFLKKKKKFEVHEFVGDARDYSNVCMQVIGMDHVYNFAADMGGVAYFNKENYYPPINNFVIDLNVLRACELANVKRVFFPSSACAYPLYKMEAGEPLNEEMLDEPAYPDQMYGWEKLTLVKLIRNSSLDIRVGILHTIYGEGQAYEGDKAKFPPQIAYKAIQAYKTGKIEVWGDGSQTRTFLHVRDAIEKIYEVMMKDEYWGEVNIGSDIEVSVKEVVFACCNILDIYPELVFDTLRPTGPRRRLCDNTKFNKYYSYRDQVSLDEGFRSIINSIKKYVR